MTTEREKIIAKAEVIKRSNDMFGDFSVALYHAAQEDERARAIHHSTELLEARDRKRDAKLLRAAEEVSDDDGYPVDIWKLADARESGEWNPELGD